MPLANLPPEDIRKAVNAHMTEIHHSLKSVSCGCKDVDSECWAHVQFLVGRKEQKMELKFPATSAPKK